MGSVLGTAAYLAPEQARGEEAGPRADIYSLGVVTYQLLSGRLPYEANSLSELALKQQRESPTPLDALNPQVRPELSRAVAMALAIDQESRPPDAIGFAEALRNGARGVAPLAATAPTAHLGTGAATRVLGRPGEPDRRHPGRAPPATRAPPAPVSSSRAAQRSAAGAPTTARCRASVRRGGRCVAFMAFLALAIVFTAAVAVAVVIATSTSNSVVHFRTVVGHDAQSAISSLRDLINQYTK